MTMYVYTFNVKLYGEDCFNYQVEANSSLDAWVKIVDEVKLSGWRLQQLTLGEVCSLCYVAPLPIGDQ